MLAFPLFPVFAKFVCCWRWVHTECTEKSVASIYSLNSSFPKCPTSPSRMKTNDFEFCCQLVKVYANEAYGALVALIAGLKLIWKWLIKRKKKNSAISVCCPQPNLRYVFLLVPGCSLNLWKFSWIKESHTCSCFLADLLHWLTKVIKLSWPGKMCVCERETWSAGWWRQPWQSSALGITSCPLAS